MTLKTKLLLGLSLAAFVLGATGLFWSIGLPVGAILFGLFLISKLLEKEAVLFDREQQARAETVEPEKGSAPGRSLERERARDLTFTSVRSR
jgi:uncharacterized membrane protein